MQKIQIDEADNSITINMCGFSVTIKSAKSNVESVITSTPMPNLELKSDDRREVIHCYILNDVETYYDPFCMQCDGIDGVNCICPKSDGDINIKYVYYKGSRHSGEAIKMSKAEVHEYITKRNNNKHITTNKRKNEENLVRGLDSNKSSCYDECNHIWSIDYGADSHDTRYVCTQCGMHTNYSRILTN
jgi:hypothetical protein